MTSLKAEMARKITFDNESGKKFDPKGIWFHAYHGDDLIVCFVSFKALQLLAGKSQIDQEAIFRENLRWIRALAARLIRSGRVEAGRLNITQVDIKAA